MNQVKTEKESSGVGAESPRPAQDQDWLRDHTSVTVTVQEVANRLHQDMYGNETEHLSVHSCPCFNLAHWYLGLTKKPKMFWPDGKGGNAWDKKPVTGSKFR